eukprot:TRINITY_DN1547_c1_g1_i1.p2 TRINITY_DN1547_c1_g1~~TRINITY_DN1547_c1_g1_i1.p2  ORF type:complete len:237 (+),score=27.60 TRINITY_DN1547_c1_g1_i1:169-879(+)
MGIKTSLTFQMNGRFGLQKLKFNDQSPVKLEIAKAVNQNGSQFNGFGDTDSSQHKVFMKKALMLAKQGAQLGQVPVGAVLVVNNKIIAEAYNEIEIGPDPTAHAEINCIRRAAQALDSWRLIDSTLYVTLEPCPMCAGAILQARIPNLVYGAQNPLLGADGSWIDMFQERSQEESLQENFATPLRPHPFHPEIKVTRGILAEECSQIMTNFFRERRREQLDQCSCDDDVEILLQKR